MAVFTEQEIMASAMPNIDAILDNALYLESGSTMITPDTVAVTENSAVQAMVVRFGDIETLSEEYGCDYIDAMVAVAEANDVDPSYLAVAVDEAEVIENPWIVDELDHVVINPQSENSFAYQFCEAMIDEFIDSDGDEIFLEAIVDDYTADAVLNELFNDTREKLQNDYRTGKMFSQLDQEINGLDNTTRFNNLKSGAAGIKYAAMHNKKAAGAIGLAAVGTAGIGAYGLKKLYDKYSSQIPNLEKIKAQARGKDKNWIGRKIASLRSLYSKWLARANAASDAGQASVFKRVAAAIMNCIDALMRKLENSIGSK